MYRTTMHLLPSAPLWKLEKSQNNGKTGYAFDKTNNHFILSFKVLTNNLNSAICIKSVLCIILEDIVLYVLLQLWLVQVGS